MSVCLRVQRARSTSLFERFHLLRSAGLAQLLVHRNDKVTKSVTNFVTTLILSPDQAFSSCDVRPGFSKCTSRATSFALFFKSQLTPILLSDSRMTKFVTNDKIYRSCIGKLYLVGMVSQTIPISIPSLKRVCHCHVCHATSFGLVAKTEMTKVTK